jgi:Na+/H+ antiporter NhaC
VVPLARVALWPLGTFIGVTLLWILYKGGAFTVLQPGRGFEGFGELFSLRGMTTVLYDGSGSTSLAVGALSGLGVAAVMAWIAGLSREIPQAAWASLRSMGVAILILYLAWMIGAVCRELGTAQYLTVLLGTSMNPLVLPAVLFFLAGAVAFSTGSSWSTMSIILPLVVGLSYELGHAIPLGGPGLLVISIGAVLEGSIFGDHCSPISDTTVMSSIASASDHVDHVRTQAPYALTTMVVAMLCGYFPAVMLELDPWLCLLFGMAVLTGIVLWYGKRVAEPELPAEAAGEGAAAEVGVEAK